MRSRTRTRLRVRSVHLSKSHRKVRGRLAEPKRLSSKPRLAFQLAYENRLRLRTSDGAFYLFVRSLEDDANAFADKAKELGLLLVPGDDFGAKGYVRIAYCVSHDMIKRSVPAFEKLFEQYESNKR